MSKQSININSSVNIHLKIFRLVVLQIFCTENFDVVFAIVNIPTIIL